MEAQRKKLEKKIAADKAKLEALKNNK